MSRISKITGITTLIVVCLLVIAASLPIGGWRALSVHSGSMEPSLSPGDLVLVRRVNPKDIKQGDVITFINRQNKKQTITHRVQGNLNTGSIERFLTQGDANSAPDMPVYAQHIVGRTEFTVPYAGRAVNWLRHPIGLFLVIYLPALSIVISELRRLARYYRSQQPYIAAEVERRFQNMRVRSYRPLAMAKMMLMAVGAALIIAVPVKAAITVTATLLDNSITITAPNTTPPPPPPPGPTPPPPPGPTPPPPGPTPPGPAPGTTLTNMLLRSVEFNCTPDNTATLNRLPEIIMYNPTNTRIQAGGWFISAASGRIHTFPSGTVFDPKANFDIEPDLQGGLRYSGDFLILFDSTGKPIDSISWGTDTSQLNLALPTPAERTMYRRLSLLTDTNQAADWAVSVVACHDD